VFVTGNSRALIVFARAPEPGYVKTRLAAELGAEEALSVYRRLAERVVAAVHAAGSYSVTVAYTPPGAEPLMRRWLGTSVALRPQSDGDLGERMATAVADAFSAGAERVVVIGTDCPEVSADVVEEAFTRLDAADVVLGPASDGGYYLIGMSRLHRALFDDVPWSSADTLRATLERARAHGLSIALLEQRRDIDTAADWRTWLASLP
jgi:rSAM/selenodomain-associated transferase 1